jgi:two-component system C4-dicarboxylate transport sensor histidine kinase DctB
MDLLKELDAGTFAGDADLPSGDHPPAVGARRLHGWLYVAAATICALVGVAAFQSVFKAHLNADNATSTRRLEFFSLSLESALDRNEALPGLMGLERKLSAALEDEPAARAASNEYLQAVAQAAKLSAAYLMDAQGLTIAASNWNQPVTFVGQNYGFRPYAQEALAGRFGRFYGIGATTGEAGYFLASRLRSAAGVQGVIAIKVGLEPIEEALKQSGEAVLVADKQGVVILSSVPEWKYRVLQPLDAATRERLASTRQYGDQPLPVLGPPAGMAAGSDEARIERGGITSSFSIARRPVGNLGWQMLILTDQREARAAAWVAAVAASALTAFALGLYLHIRLTRREREDKRRAERALVQVSQDLERRIGQRTADLTQANATLERKVLELKRAEAILRTTSDSAVQAGKLTVLGQMSAGMTHELNQPLAALHTLSDNAVNLIEQSRVEEARENLVLIGQLAARMGRIVTQLKTFTRKDPVTVSAVQVADAVDHALMIVESRRREIGAAIEVHAIEPQLRVKADAVRLEQVLVNLLRNGLDAVAGQVKTQLHVSAAREGGRVRISIRDFGPGIAESVLPRLFEPFHTTKPVGQGLGLGLSLSLAIVESFGGKLEGRNLEGEGAEFSVVLEAA